MVHALRLQGVPLWFAWVLVLFGPVALVAWVWSTVPESVLGLGVSVLGLFAAIFAQWLYRQPVPEQAAWESALVCGSMTFAGGLLIAGGLGVAL